MPECLVPLLGWDLLGKLWATVTFSEEEKMKLAVSPLGLIYTLRVPREEEWRMFEGQEGHPLQQEITSHWPTVWAEDNRLGLATHQESVVIELLPNTLPLHLRQYPIPREALEGINPYLQRLQDNSILVPCKSPWNTPLLPVRKPGTQNNRPVQDLHVINQATVTLHPTVPNPYTLLSLYLPPQPGSLV